MEISYSIELPYVNCIGNDNISYNISPYLLNFDSKFLNCCFIDKNIKKILFVPTNIDGLEIDSDNSHIKEIDLINYQHLSIIECSFYMKIINPPKNLIIIKHI